MTEVPRTKKRLRSNSIPEGLEDHSNNQLIGAIHVSPLPIDVKCDQLLDHFAQYGCVKEVVVRCQTKNSFAVGIVTFEKAEDAERALAGSHRVLNKVRSISTAIADPALTCIAQYEGPFQSAMTLTDLPDDCLRTIFRMTPMTDLCSIVDTCSRFRAIRKSLIYKEIKSWTFGDITDVGKVVKKFGSGIKDLILQFDDRQPENSLRILQLAMDYCSFTLKSLNLRGFRFDEQMVPRLRGLFINLESLTLYLCEFDESISTSLLSECRKLIKLDFSLEEDDNFPAKSLISCPPVIWLELDFRGICDNNKILEVAQFLKSQNKLYKLSMNGRLSHPILNVIVECCSKNLKSLHLIGSIKEMVKVPKLLFTNLEELKMKYFTLDESMTDLFSNCENLTKLSCYLVGNIYGTFKPSDLPHLEFLKLDNSSKVSVNEAVRFEGFLKTKKKLKTIRLRFFNFYNRTSVFEIIADKNVQVVELYGCDIDNFKNCFALSKMERITTLKLFRCYDTHDTSVALPFISNISSVDHLHHLELDCLTVDDKLLVKISKFKNLRRLYLVSDSEAPLSPLDLDPLKSIDKLSVLKLRGNWSLSDSVLINLVTNLKKLTVLTLNLNKFSLGYKIYNKIMEIVRKREQVLTVSEDWWWSFYERSLLYIERDITTPNT